MASQDTASDVSISSSVPVEADMSISSSVPVQANRQIQSATSRWGDFELAYLRPIHDPSERQFLNTLHSLHESSCTACNNGVRPSSQAFQHVNYETISIFRNSGPRDLAKAKLSDLHKRPFAFFWQSIAVAIRSFEPESQRGLSTRRRNPMQMELDHIDTLTAIRPSSLSSQPVSTSSEFIPSDISFNEDQNEVRARKGKEMAVDITHVLAL